MGLIEILVYANFAGLIGMALFFMWDIRKSSLQKDP